jgi:hypothetical protein
MSGSKPGERRGGRRKGVPNKVTLLRAAELEAKRQRTGNRPAIEVMSDAMNYFRGLAAQYQPVAARALAAMNDEERLRHTPDETLFVKYLKLAADIASDLANYETPKLASTTLRGDSDAPINATLTVNIVGGNTTRIIE